MRTVKKPQIPRDTHARNPPPSAERNIGAIARLERSALHDRTAADRLSDAISRTTGSAPFVIVHLLWFVGWIVINLGLTGIAPFDPFPFSFLTLVVSLEAIFLSVFVLMSQNRMTRQADKRAHLDLQIDLLAEQELTTILHMLRALCMKHKVEVDLPDDLVLHQLRDTDVHELALRLDQRLPDH
jgi:uncharacterized membrane protein